MEKVRIAMIGAGAISGIYLKNLTHLFREVELIGVCDLVPARAEKAAAYVREEIARGAHVPCPVLYKDMLEAFTDPRVEVVLNLTRPYEHFAVSRAALEHGKHVYSEKPLGICNAEADALIALAEEKHLLLGGAPDTFMGAGIQTARKLIDDGVIGEVIGANCAMISHGPETWHPDPAFFYKAGGGPMLDMGPYYVTALVQLLGEAESVMGMTKKSFAHRLITSQPHCGTVVEVETDTYLAGCIRFTSGAIAQLFTTFDVHATASARFEVYGTKGSLAVPDPNTFGGPVLLLRPEDAASMPKTDPGLDTKARPDFYRGYLEIPLMFDYCENSRGLGLADMAKALRTGRDWRANYRQQRHVLEILTAFGKAGETGTVLPVSSTYARSAPMRNDPMHGVLDD